MTILITDSACELLVGGSSLNRLMDAGFSGRADDGAVSFVKLDSGDLVVTSGREDEEYFYAAIEEKYFSKIPKSGQQDAIARIHRVLRSVARGAVRLPSAWAEYHHKNLITFFAMPSGRSDEGLRWIAAIYSQDHCVSFELLTTRDNRIELEEYRSLQSKSRRNEIDPIVLAAKGRRSQIAVSEQIVERVDFDTVGSVAISQSLRYEEWLQKLSDGQRKVLEVADGQNIRILGPAGSGKTSALCLRALRELRNDAEGQKRILFATHSWAMTERIDGALSAMNGGVSPPKIEVFPLLQVLKDVVRGDYFGGVGVLGEDSTEGRAFQVELIEEILADVSSPDLTSFVNLGLHESTFEAVTHERLKEIAENLYQEFSGVLLPAGIRPQDPRKIAEYFELQRTDEMPPFKTRGDLMFVLHVYKGFTAKLREWGFVTNDQLVSDAIRVLETFAWDVKRESAGYDLILVDELQLFDAQERMALSLLARSQESPVFVTAEDPSQGVFATVSPAWSKGSTLSGGRQIELSTTHRFNKGILALVKHLYLAFPLNAGAMPIEPGSSVAEGVAPSLYEAVNADERDRFAKRITRELHGHGGSVAVITIGASPSAVASVLEEVFGNVVLVESVDDTEKLSYQKRAVVVGGWEYLGGTQFDRVLVIGNRLDGGRTAFERLRETVAIYVAVTRASKELALLLAEGVPDVLSRALSLGLLRKQS